VLDGHDAAACTVAEAIVKLQEVDRRALEPRQAGRQALLDLRRDVFEVLDIEAELGRQMERLRDLRQQPAERFFRLAIAVLCSSVDPVDSARDRAAYRLALCRVILVYEDAADSPAAENDFRDGDAATSELSIFQYLAPKA